MRTPDVAWATVAADQPSDSVLVDILDAGDSAKSDIENCTAYGHGGVLPKGTSVVIARADDGGAAIAVAAVRPSWASAVGDVYSATGTGRGLRISDADGKIETRGAPVVLGADGAQIVSITRSGDMTQATGEMVSWMAAVHAALGLPGVPPNIIGQVISSSQHKASA